MNELKSLDGKGTKGIVLRDLR